MQTITLYEHERLYVAETNNGAGAAPCLQPKVFERIRKFDLDRAAREAGPDREASNFTIFDWSPREYAKARQYVGVLAFGGVTIEVLPKIEKSKSGETWKAASGAPDGGTAVSQARTTVEGEDKQSRVQLLHMLRYAGVLKAKSRDIAMLASSRATMGELLFWLFAQRVREELGRGMIREYEERREELGVIRGRIDIKQYAQASVRRPGKIPCIYERHSVNTSLLRLLRASCEFLLRASTDVRTREVLREVLVPLDEVDREPLSPMLADLVQMTRREERFDDIVSFCRMLAYGQRPDARAGDTLSFSLLFDMNQLFEGFLAGFFREEVLRCPEFRQLEFREQGRSFDKALLRLEGGSKTMRLKPDLVFADSAQAGTNGQSLNLIMDAKWKRPSNNGGRPSGDVLYQMYAYATQFDAPTVVVLYPQAAGSSPAEFRFAEPGAGRHGFERGARLLVRYVPLDLSLNERAGRRELSKLLALVLRQARGLSAAELEVAS